MAHEELKAQYAQDALWHPRPWELWEWRPDNPWIGTWGPCDIEYQPFFHENTCGYRRKPDAPEKNCTMCKHAETPSGYRLFDHCMLMDDRGCICNECLGSKLCPDWCPLDQPKEKLGTPISRQEALEISKVTLETAEAERVAYMETKLGKQLKSIREKAIEKGVPLLSEDEVLGLDQPKTIDTLFEALGNSDEQSIEEVKGDLEELGIDVQASMARLKAIVEKCRNESAENIVVGVRLADKTIQAAEDLLSWLEGFDLLRRAEKIVALRKALDELEGR